MGSIEEDVSAPLGDDAADGLDGKKEQRHRGSQRDHLGAHQRGNFAEEVEVNFKFDRIERNVNDVQTTYPRRPIDTVAGMTPERLSNAHDNVTRFGQRRIARQVSNHARRQPVVCIPGTKRLFQEFDTQSFDLVYMPGAGKPAVHRANMSLGSTSAYLSREECPDRRTGWCFRSKQIQTALPAPLFIAGNGRQNGFLHLLRRVTGIQNSPCLSKHFWVVDFKLIG